MQRAKKLSLYDSAKIVYISIDDIRRNPDQPRRKIDTASIRELSNSIARYGVLQPLSVRKRGGGYELISGERRLRAAKLAGLKDVPCIVLDISSPETAVLALVENLQRHDIDFIEEAEGLSRLVYLHGMSQEEAARRVGRSQSAVANKLRLLKLPPDVLERIRETGLTERHARALVRLDDDEEVRAALEEILRDGKNVAAAEEYIDGLISGTPQRQRAKRIYVFRDIRLFINTLARSVAIMKQAGVDAECGREETETDIILTVRIPKQQTTGMTK